MGLTTAALYIALIVLLVFGGDSEPPWAGRRRM